MTVPQQADFLYRSIERVSDWIKYQDSKAGAVLVILAIGAADLIAQADRLVDAHETSKLGVAASTMFWVAVTAAVVTVAFVALTLFPRVEPKSGPSLFYFGSVAGYRTAEDFHKEVQEMSDDSLARHLATQAWELARLAAAKVAFVRIATGAALCFLGAWATARFLLAVA